MINYELKISLFVVKMLVTHFDSKFILKFFEKKIFNEHTATLLVMEVQKGPKPGAILHCALLC